MKLFRLIIFLLLASLSSYSQSEIRGTITDSSNTAIEFANVILTDKKNEIITGTVTDESGGFKLLVRDGNYKLSISYIGYTTIDKDLAINDNIKLDKIILTLSENNLDEVVIKGNKPLIERKIDRIVFNVDNSISALGGDGIDVLTVTPGIRVVNDKISMIGRSNMGVMINEKIINLSGDDLVTFIRNLNSDDIKRIEVITNPSAKYDAEGNGGLINIVTKKQRNDSYNWSITNSLSKSEKSIYRGGASFNYKKDKLTLASRIGYSKGSLEPFQKYVLTYPNYIWEEENNKRNYLNSIRGGLSVDYSISPKTNIGGEYSFSDSKPIVKSNNVSRIYSPSKVLDSLISNDSRIQQDTKNHSLNLYSTVKLDTLGTQINFNIDYLNYNKKINNTFFTNSFFSNGEIKPNSFFSANNLSDLDINIFSSKLDLILPTKWIDLEFGGKLTFTNNESDIAFFNNTSGISVLDPSKTNAFTYEENLQALYISGTKYFSNRVSLNVGLRGEFTQTQGVSKELNQTNTNDYFELFPSLYFNYVIKDYKILTFNYNRRINRPKYNNLNPFQFFTNSYNVTQGNPFLAPSFANNFELSYIYKNASYSSLYCNYTTNGVDQVTFVSPDSIIQNVIPTNFYNQIDVGIFQWYSFKLASFWENTIDASLFYSKTDSDIPSIVQGVDSWSSSINTNSSFVLDANQRFKAQLGFTYQSPSLSGSYKLSSFYQLTFGIKGSFFNKTLTAAINAYDILKTDEKTFTQVVNGIRQENFDYRDLRRIRFSMKYNFGKAIKSKKIKTSNEEEKKRL
ncbi:TonB-dependent receptor domain-containing protein [Olleya sp. Bg11-27]|uniref:TonB-dependent receptor domain-containing protein n=1 Tax=Olleya sp. Bg11-27 TaxID=2058135 RepID=UPI000C304594|nr:TonB-dependent receptor [Olleya sp. Bg11-27]AUC77546.1 TonB-dependent receptor [Olleya sp. Bg11-27]